jgi:hypothetical protein
LHVLAYVNSFHLFTNMRVGGTRRTSDVTALKKCPFFAKITANRTEWLGKDGYILGDGGTTDPQGIVLTPIHMPRTVEDKWFNFCHSSTRFFVEETFGRWKNRLCTLSLSPYLSLSVSVLPSVCLLPVSSSRKHSDDGRIGCALSHCLPTCLSLSLSFPVSQRVRVGTSTPTCLMGAAGGDCRQFLILVNKSRATCGRP